MKPEAILFDLDGTLLDTAPDLLFVLNKILLEANHPTISLDLFRSKVGFGAKKMLQDTLGLTLEEKELFAFSEKFMKLYLLHLADNTTFFPQMDYVLDHLEEKNIPWGIVTNKLTCHTQPLLKALQIEHKPKCVICGDTLAKAKPDPLPILHACQLLEVPPENCLFIGDAESDVIASKAAGTKTLVALYGYIDCDDPKLWLADGYINEPIEILQWLR